MRFLLKYLRPYIKECVLAPLFKLLEATLDLFVPLVMTWIIDEGIAKEDTSFILLMGGLLLGFAIVGAVIAITAQYFAAKAAIYFQTDVKHALFEHIVHMSAESKNKLGSETLITRMTGDMNQVASCVNWSLRLFLRSPLIVVGAMVMAFAIDVRCALIFAVLIPVLSFIVFLCLRITIPLYKNVQKRLDKVLLHTRENLAGVRVIRAFLRQDKEKETFGKENSKLQKEQLHVGRISSLMNPLTLLIVNAAMMLLIYVGGVRVDIGGLTQGQVVALINYMSQILIELIKMADVIILVNKSLASADRIKEIFEIGDEDRRKEDSCDGVFSARASEKTKDESDSPVLECKDMSFSYPGSRESALEDINISVNKGETLGIIGGTGSGKTTLLSLLLGYYKASRGVLDIFDRDSKDWAQDALRKRVGYVHQRSVLFSGTIRDNLLWGDESATDEKMWEALRIAQADEFVSQKDGLDTVVEAGGKNFSGGQRQRLCIARALVRNADIYVLDDAFSALDTATEAKLRVQLSDHVKKLKATLVIVSQRISSVKNADGILVLEDGKQVGYGTHDELMSSCEVYREIERIGGDAS